jgi:cell wall-associated NlpC family hydrolase
MDNLNTEIYIKAFIEEARKYINTPFRHQGRDKNGLDCIGIIVVPLINLKMIDKSEDSTKYKRYGLSKNLISILLKYCEIVEKINLRPGDIILFSKQNSQHLAIYTGTGIIHANNLVGKVVEHSLSEDTYNTISKVFRYKRGLNL